MRQACRVTIAVAVGLAALGLPEEAAAQTGQSIVPPRAELWGALAVGAPAGNGTLESAYAPPMLLGGPPLDSRASQVLSVEAGSGLGVDVGVNIFFSRVVGIQGGFAAESADVSGTNGDYYTFLKYISTPPPDYQPREVTAEQSMTWAPTTGTLGHRSLAVGGVVRWRAPTGRVGGTLAGGVDIEWITGEIESLGYTQFILGGHSTLFAATHRVRVGPAAGERSFRPYVGGDVHVAIARRVALMAGVRVRLASGVSVPIRVVDLVDPTESTWVPELSEVAAALDGQPLELPGTRWRTIFGVKLFLR